MDASALTEQILTLRKDTDAFRASIITKSKKLTYTFYDGPPFTSGDPHYGHLLQSTVKDMVPRRMTMRGYRVERKRGWDCHGIPAENFVNKKLGITSKKQVEEEFGLQNYIEACRSMVNQVNDNRKWTIDRIGRWVDMENAYFTMDNDYIESVICLFSDLYHRNLIYKGFKVLGYSRALGTALSNSEIAEGYEMRQDSAVTVKFSLKNDVAVIGKDFLANELDNAVEVVAGVLKDEQGRVLMMYKNKHNARYFPGGKMEPGEIPVDTLKREILEELGVEVTSEVFLGHTKTVQRSKLYRIHYFQIAISGTPTLQEVSNHGMLERVEKIPSENKFGYVLKFADLIIAHPDQLRHEFNDIHILYDGILGQEKSGEASISILPRTTTPWTLPANMFAAVHREIDYRQIFDIKTQEYYILAEQCLANYYKSPEEYIEVTNFKGEELVGLSYKPLFEYYTREEYKAQIHKILHADFVTTDSGTGIVHEAPAFGADDYELIAGVLGKDNAQEWLFDPVNEYGEFTVDAPDFVGQNVIEANSSIIKELKSRGLLVKQETINHSYPHCPRTKTPLIYKAIESWFVKEEELKTLTVPSAEQIRFVPETVKQRFINGLASAPDRNISRTRYRGAPLPVWVSDDDHEPPLVLSSKEEIFQRSKTGSKNLVKFIFTRHGETDFNVANRGRDAFGQAVLTEVGKQQATDMVHKLRILGGFPEVIVLSGFKRTFETATPLLKEMLGEAFDEVQKKYVLLADNFSIFLKEKGFAPFFADENCQKLVKIHEGVYVDYRITELFISNKHDRAYFQPDIPGEYFPRWSDAPATPGGESIKEQYKRVKASVDACAQLFVGKTVLMVSHSAALRMLRMSIQEYDFDLLRKDKEKRKNKHTTPEIHYYDIHTGQGLDLHRPYIDRIWFVKDGKKFTRIPEVLDCWFESGAMPYGQDHFMKLTSSDGNSNEKVILVDAAKGIINADDEYSIESFSLNKEIADYLLSLPNKKIVVTNTSGEKREKMISLLNGYDFDFFTLENNPSKSDESYFTTLLNQFALDAHQVIYFDHQPNALESAKKAGIQSIFLNGNTHDTLDRLKEQLIVDNVLNRKSSFNNCANFIAEGLDQTRGWFRALHVLGHAYHGQNVFQNVVVTGMILAEDGKKMSKSLQNYPDPTLLINQYGADALRLYLLGSPVVRAEPLRFSEKGVEQMLKDVIIPLQNVFNFFKMYAEVDKRKDQGTQVRFMRHALKKTLKVQEETQTGRITSEGEKIDDIDLPLSDAGCAQLVSPEFIEQVVCIDPEVIICSDFLRAQQTAEGVQSVLHDYLGKEVHLEIDAHWGLGAKPESVYDAHNTKEDGEYTPDAQGAATTYQQLLEKHAGKRILIVSHKRRFRYLRQWLFDQKIDVNGVDAREKWLINSSQAVTVPLVVVSNELDQWVLAELHRTISAVDSALKNYFIEEATLHLMGFVDKLTNRYLRRSRRRFRTEDMTEDKQQAYTTLFTVIRTYLQLCAPFIPFVTEQLRQELGGFTLRHDTHPSVHLQSWPMGSAMYINEHLIEEIETVRKIIKGALYLRAKHQIKVKQPLPGLSFRV